MVYTIVIVIGTMATNKPKDNITMHRQLKEEAYLHTYTIIG